MTLHLPPDEIIARNKAKQKQWRLDHPDRILDFHRKYNAKPAVSARKTEWARNHKDAINERRRLQYHQKRATAPESEEAPTEPVV